MLGGAGRASLGAGDVGAGTGNKRPEPLGPAPCTSSSPAGLVVVVVVVIVVTGMTTAGASVVCGPVGACVRATVKLRKGAVGGSVGLAVIFGGLVMGT